MRTGPGVLLEFVCKGDPYLLLELRICEYANARKTTLGLSLRSVPLWVVPILESDAIYQLHFFKSQCRKIY